MVKRKSVSLIFCHTMYFQLYTTWKMNKAILEKPRIWCIIVNSGESESWSSSCCHSKF